MGKNNGKKLILNTLVLIFCCVIVGLYCLNPIKETIKNRKLTFNTDGGSAVAALESPDCGVIERPANPTKEGFIFEGWLLDGKPYNFDEEICGDVELKASWREMEPDKKYVTIYLDSQDGNEPSAVTVEDGEVPEKPADPVREGYVFKGWKVNGADYNFDSPLKDGDTVSAVWEKSTEPEPPVDENKVYKVSFNLNGGTGSTPAQQEVKGGSKATAPSEKPTRDKFDFKGWSTNKNATSQNLTSTNITKDTTFYAVWVSNVKTYTVTINKAGGTFTKCTTPQKVPEGGNPSGCTGGTRAGFTFDGWTDGTSSFRNLSQFVITKNVTITAKWTALPKYNYSIKYINSFGGAVSGCTNYSNTTYLTTVTVNNLCKPSNVGADTYEFDYWANASGAKVTSVTLTSTSPSQNLTLHTKAKSYSVKCVKIMNSMGTGYSGYCKLMLANGSTPNLFVKMGSSYAKFGGQPMIAVYDKALDKLAVCDANKRNCVSATGAPASES